MYYVLVSKTFTTFITFTPSYPLQPLHLILTYTIYFLSKTHSSLFTIHHSPFTFNCSQFFNHRGHRVSLPPHLINHPIYLLLIVFHHLLQAVDYLLLGFDFIDNTLLDFKGRKGSQILLSYASEPIYYREISDKLSSNISKVIYKIMFSRPSPLYLDKFCWRKDWSY